MRSEDNGEGEERGTSGRIEAVLDTPIAELTKLVLLDMAEYEFLIIAFTLLCLLSWSIDGFHFPHGKDGSAALKLYTE